MNEHYFEISNVSFTMFMVSKYSFWLFRLIKCPRSPTDPDIPENDKQLESSLTSRVKILKLENGLNSKSKPSKN